MLDILYQDDVLVAINKPSGLLVHRSPIDKHETRFALQEVRNQIGCHVFPIHRLDKPTSGVLLFAKSSEVAQTLCAQFAVHSVQKTYIALVRGHYDKCETIDHAFRDDPDELAATGDRPLLSAITEVRGLAQIELPVSVDKYPTSRYSLVECKPITGRKHQIRRHLKHINHPIIGDAKHGKSLHNRFFNHHFGATRLLLAATQLCFDHPVSRARTTINAPISDDFFNVIRRCDFDRALPRIWQPR